MSFWTKRKRMSGEPVLTGSQQGYSLAPPAGDDASAEIGNAVPGSYYRYHQGDIFTPGVAGLALDPVHEWPLMCVWGNGSLRNPFAFPPTTPQIIMAKPAVTEGALRGTIVQGLRVSTLQPILGQYKAGPANG
jgi:hypothetical protein